MAVTKYHSFFIEEIFDSEVKVTEIIVSICFVISRQNKENWLMFVFYFSYYFFRVWYVRRIINYVYVFNEKQKKQKKLRNETVNKFMLSTNKIKIWASGKS